MPRVVLVLCGMSFVAFGASFLAWPVWMAGFVDLGPTTPTAITEIRGMYGGLEIGIGVFLLIAAARRDWVGAGLAAACLAFAGFAAGRITGLAIDGVWQPATWRLLAVEIPAAVLAAWALRRTRG